MTSQTRRAAASIAANIAEGYGRDSSGSFIQFLRMSQGSLKELETHLLLSARVSLVPTADIEPLLQQCDELGKMLLSLIRSIQRKRSTEQEQIAVFTTHYSLPHALPASFMPLSSAA
jgi:four helix bundle protein